MSTETSREQKPDWWHRFGESVGVADEFTPSITEITLTSGSCHIKISKGKRNSTWKVRWIIYTKGSHKVEGIRTFSTSELRLAFGLKTFGEGGSDPDFVAKHRVTAGAQGQYVRDGTYLNIPCMGTGGSGDPNASIRVSAKVSKAVEIFIGRVSTVS